jgi:hypothetical protein
MNALRRLIYVGDSQQVGITDYYKMYFLIVFHFEESSGVIPFYFGVLLVKLKVFRTDWVIVIKQTNSFHMVV